MGAALLVISLVGAWVAVERAWIAVERAQKASTDLEQAEVAVLQQSKFQETEALLSAMQTAQDLKKLVKDNRTLPLRRYPSTSPILVLQTILDNISERTLLAGHKDNVRSASFSPDGHYLVTASEDGTARLWDLSGKLLAVLKGHQSIVNSASFSPDGQHLVTASFDKTARLWDLSGKLLAVLKGHQDNVRSASFSPDGNYLVTTSDDKTARLWDLSGNPLIVLRHQSVVYTAKFSPDGKHLVTASGKTAQLWKWSNKVKPAILSVSLSLDGKSLVTVYDDGTVRLERVKSLDQLLAQGCNWLKDYLVTHPEEQKVRKICKQISK